MKANFLRDRADLLPLARSATTFRRPTRGVCIYRARRGMVRFSIEVSSGSVYKATVTSLTTTPPR
jgi:hypothetical protein